MANIYSRAFFVVDLKILPLKCYDIILGMDWLEMHSPMEIHWQEKWLSFYHNGTKLQLHGIPLQEPSVGKISLSQVQQFEKDDNIWCILELFWNYSWFPHNGTKLQLQSIPLQEL